MNPDNTQFTFSCMKKVRRLFPQMSHLENIYPILIPASKLCWLQSNHLKSILQHQHLVLSLIMSMPATISDNFLLSMPLLPVFPNYIRKNPLRKVTITILKGFFHNCFLLKHLLRAYYSDITVKSSQGISTSAP